MKTYLSRAHSGDRRYVTRRAAADESGLDEATVQVVLSELTESGILEAKLQVRCPKCNTQHGIHAKKSAVPDFEEVCFNCGQEYNPGARRNWEVIYDVVNNPHDFFQNEVERIRWFLEGERDLPSEFFCEELERFRDMENPQKRGRDFDYLMGLFFQQLPGVEIRIKEQGNTGEVDVHMVCLSAEDWLVRAVGSTTLIENKWESNAIQKKEVGDFYLKAQEIPDCKRAYFASMSGFSRGQRKDTGALANLRNYENPQIVDLWKDDIESMFEDGTPKPLLKQRLMK